MAPPRPLPRPVGRPEGGVPLEDAAAPPGDGPAGACRGSPAGAVGGPGAGASCAGPGAVVPWAHGVAAAGDPMWQRRGKKLYYYRTRRVGRRVVREYFGSGPEAVLAAALDQ